MSWRNVPKKENYFPLFAEDWNALVDAVDDLYYMLQALPSSAIGGTIAGVYLYGDLLPWQDLYFSLGDPTHRFLNVWAKNIYADPIWTTSLYASENIFVNDKPVLKDGDPISIYDIQNPAQNTLSNLMQQYITQYQSQILSQLQQIQTTLQNTNVLINSYLANELYNTYSYLFQFNYPSGVIKLFSPKKYYTTIIRGWYAISTGSSGLAQMMGQYSLTPVGIIPLSVPSLSIPDMFLGLYYDEPILLYYNNVPFGTYLQLILNIIQQWTGVAIGHPSGIEPDPYKPPTGWKVFFDFLSQSEISSSNWRQNYIASAQVQNGILTVQGQPNSNSSLTYDNTSIAPTRAAMTFRFRNVTSSSSSVYIMYSLQNGQIAAYPELRTLTLNPDGTVTTNLYDAETGQNVVSNIILQQGAWYLFMYDFPTNTAQLIDANGNILAKGNMNTWTTSSKEAGLTIFIPNAVYTIDIDWLGFG